MIRIGPESTKGLGKVIGHSVGSDVRGSRELAGDCIRGGTFWARLLGYTATGITLIHRATHYKGPL
jgi:hypothetical protein